MHIIVVAAAWQAAVAADAGSAEAPVAVAEPVVAAEVVRPQTVKLPALTAVRVRIDKDLVSKTAVIGEEFDIVLMTPIVVGAGYAIPAGTRGRGWVIHASKARMGGKAGELLLGARYLKVGDIEIPLRSLKVGPPQGKDNTGLSAGLTATIGVAGMFVSGGQARVDSGMDAIAKTAAEVELPVALLHKAAIEGPAIVATRSPAAEASAPVPAVSQPPQQ